MKILVRLLLVISPALALAETIPDISNEQLLLQSRTLVSEFEKQLGGKLKAAMQQGGPVTAIKVCSEEADAIAKAIGTQHHATVKRITDKPRNPNNRADNKQALALQRLATLISQQPSQPLEVLTHEDTGQTYYRAIQIKPLCLTCHGTNIAAPVQDALAQLYPEDKATGYQAGDLRGAFMVEW